MHSSVGGAGRRLVLGTALLLALVVSAALDVPVVVAQGSASGPPVHQLTANGRAAAPTKDTATSDAAASSAAAGGSDDQAANGPGTAANRSRDGVRHGISVDNDSKRVRVRGLGDDREYDSFDRFLASEPEIAGMIVAVVAIIFLSPAIIVGLVIWYRIRKARMANETMLKLAERGVIAPGEAMQAISTGRAPAMATASSAALPAGGSLLDQAHELRRNAARSDLRKSVILGALGLAFTLHSMFADDSPSAVGLILLFIGIGYGVLWWFEARQGEVGRGSSPGASGTGS